MDESMIIQISEFLSKWGFWQLLSIMVIVLLTMILKQPIKKAAERYQERTGVDKSVITWVISIIPFVLGFGAAFILELVSLSWDVNLVDWASVTKQASVLSTAAMGLFEMIKKWAEAFTAKKIAAAVEKIATASAKPETVQPAAKVITLNKQSEEGKKKDVIKL